MAELTRLLTAEEKQIVRDYIAARYGIVPNPYTTARQRRRLDVKRGLHARLKTHRRNLRSV